MDPFVLLAQDNDMAINTGKGKMFPQGPECIFNGKMVPMFCCCSENRSITSELLTKLLVHTDGCKAIDQSDGITPFLLLDGHGGCFEVKFLKYINYANDEGHK